jgi:hypothetical protein
MNRGFDELVDGSGLEPGERQRLQIVHDLLVAAGPPPELPAALREPPQPVARRPTIALPGGRSRRVIGTLIAAAIAAACFGGGYVLGERLQSDEDGSARVVPMHGLDRTAQAWVSLGAVEPGGNWPLELEVSGLPKQSGERAYYELFVARRGKLAYPCGGFKMSHGTTTVHFSVPYEVTEKTRLVVTAIEPGKSRWPGQIVMTTA